MTLAEAMPALLDGKRLRPGRGYRFVQRVRFTADGADVGSMLAEFSFIGDAPVTSRDCYVTNANWSADWYALTRDDWEVF